MTTEMAASVYDLPDYHALVRRIREIDRAGGDSALARLVTADWLEEQGEAERAFFARIHVRYEAIWQEDTPERDEISDLLEGRFSVTRFASPPFAPDCPRRMDPKPDEGPPQTWHWMGGWVRVVRCPLAWWLAHGPDVCRRHPVRQVVVTDKETPGGESGHCWYRRKEDTPWGDYRHAIPARVWDRLTRCREKTREGWANYYSPTEAKDDLNDAALRWAEAVADGETE